jgi:hypothetical protein
MLERETQERDLMHSLVRFIVDEGRSDQLVQFGERLNRIAPGKYRGLDHVPDQFSVSLCSDIIDWYDHRKAILDFIVKYRDALVDAKRHGIAVLLDIIVHKEDREGNIYTVIHVDREVIEALEAFDGEFELSVVD